jgi:hypothetical protein
MFSIGPPETFKSNSDIIQTSRVQIMDTQGTPRVELDYSGLKIASPDGYLVEIGVSGGTPHWGVRAGTTDLLRLDFDQAASIFEIRHQEGAEIRLQTTSSKTTPYPGTARLSLHAGGESPFVAAQSQLSGRDGSVTVQSSDGKYEGSLTVFADTGAGLSLEYRPGNTVGDRRGRGAQLNVMTVMGKPSDGLAFTRGADIVRGIAP